MESGSYHTDHIFKIHSHGLKVSIETTSQSISYHTKSLPSRKGESMFYPDSYLRDLSIHLFFFRSQWMEFCCFLWSENLFELHKGSISESKHFFDVREWFESHLFEDGTIVFLSFCCFSEKENPFLLVSNESILDSMTLLLS